MIFYIFLIWLSTMSCGSSTNNPDGLAETKDSKATLQGAINPWIFLGVWENYPPLDDPFERLWAEFSFDENNDLVVNRAKIMRKTGELSARMLGHEQTLEWLNAELILRSNYHFTWRFQGIDWDFDRVTPIIEPPSENDQWITRLEEEIRTALTSIRWLFGGGAETAAFEAVAQTLQSWKGTSLSADQLRKISAIEEFLKLSSRGHSIIADDLDALGEEIFVAKMKAAATQLRSYVEAGLTCGASVTDLGDFHSLVFGKDLCTGENLNTLDRAISAMAIVAGSSAGIRKVLQHTGVSGGTAASISSHADDIISSSQGWDNLSNYNHVIKGEFKFSADGLIKLKSGMHTNLGFDHFLNHSKKLGREFNIKEVSQFNLERIEAGGDILSQTLPNGVRRLQLPRDAWANGDAFRDASLVLNGETRIRGIKTLWPSNLASEKIGNLSKKVLERHPQASSGLLKSTIDGINISVRIDSNRNIITSYPSWIQ